MAIATAVNDLNCKHIITSPIEHHVVLHTVEHYTHSKNITFSYVALTKSGEVDYEDLESQLLLQSRQGKKCLVSLMHANNELGSLLDISLVGCLCREHGALFHSDCVQTIGHYPMDLKVCGMHFASAAGHKFHGPKGAGLLYVSEEIKAHPLIFGGGQERKLRAGTENVYGIVGFAKALDIASACYQHDKNHITEMNHFMKEQLRKAVSFVSFNNPEQSLYTILSVCFPIDSQSDYLVTSFDMKGICVSGGSACSGDGGSHVMRAIGKAKSCATIRFSFSKFTTKEDVVRAVEVAKSIFREKQNLEA